MKAIGFAGLLLVALVVGLAGAQPRAGVATFTDAEVAKLKLLAGGLTIGEHGLIVEAGTVYRINTKSLRIAGTQGPAYDLDVAETGAGGRCVLQISQQRAAASAAVAIIPNKGVPSGAYAAELLVYTADGHRGGLAIGDTIGVTLDSTLSGGAAVGSRPYPLVLAVGDGSSSTVAVYRGK